MNRLLWLSIILGLFHLACDKGSTGEQGLGNHNPTNLNSMGPDEEKRVHVYSNQIADNHNPSNRDSVGPQDEKHAQVYSNLIAGNNFSCYADEKHKTTCFGPGLGTDAPIVKDAPQEKMITRNASMHEPFACGIKEADHQFYCWGETKSQTIRDFLASKQAKELLGIAIGDDSACVIETNALCEHPSAPFVSGSLDCTANVQLRRNQPWNNATSDDLFKADRCMHDVLKMWGQSFIGAKDSYYARTDKKIEGAYAMVESQKVQDMAILESNGHLSGLFFKNSVTNDRPNRLLYNADKLTDLLKTQFNDLGETKIKMVAAGRDFACVVMLADHTLHCYGEGAGALNLPPGLGVKDLAAGPNHLCAVTLKDQLKCFGTVRKD